MFMLFPCREREDEEDIQMVNEWWFYRWLFRMLLCTGQVGFQANHVTRSSLEC